MVATVVGAIALLVSLGFNYLQYTWREEDRKAHEREKAEAKDEQLRKERLPPEFFNASGLPNPIRISGSQHSVHGPYLDAWGPITVLNPTQSHMRITLDQPRLVIDGAEWVTIGFAFHLKANDRERYATITLVENEKQDYNLHFLFPDDKYPKGLCGELRLKSSNREDEPFTIPISFG
jgi:hypothetical protein